MVFLRLGLVPIWVLDAFVLNRIAPFGVIPMLLPLAVAAVAVLEGAYAGTGFGLAVGLLWELSYAGGFGGLVFGMALAGMAVGAVSQYVLSQNFFSCLLCSAVVLGGAGRAAGAPGPVHSAWTPWTCCSGWRCLRCCSPCAGLRWSI